MGSMGSNEMCNFYMMYYQDRNDPDPFPYGSGCFGNSASFPANEYPEGKIVFKNNFKFDIF